MQGWALLQKQCFGVVEVLISVTVKHQSSSYTNHWQPKQGSVSAGQDGQGKGGQGSGAAGQV